MYITRIFIKKYQYFVWCFRPEEEHENEDDDVGEGEGEGGEKAEEQEEPVQHVEEEPGMWEESFGSHTDSKPYGPSAVNMDFSVFGMNHVYGIPEHANRFALTNTK